MVTGAVTDDRVMVDRAVLAEFMALSRPVDRAARHLHRAAHEQLLTELTHVCMPPPFPVLADQIGRAVDLESDMDPARQAHLDRVQAAVRSYASGLGLDLTAPINVFAGMVLLDFLRDATLFDHAGGRFSDEEATAVLALVAVVSAALVRWVPTETVPS